MMLLRALLYLLFAAVAVGIPAVLGAVIALNWTKADRLRHRARAHRLEQERDGALRALAVIGQVRTNHAARTLAPVPPESLATSPVRVLRPPLAAVPTPPGRSQ